MRITYRNFKKLRLALEASISLNLVLLSILVLIWLHLAAPPPPAHAPKTVNKDSGLRLGHLSEIAKPSGDDANSLNTDHVAPGNLPIASSGKED